MALGRTRLIAQISGFYPPHLGGVENVAQALARCLAKRHEVLVLTTTCGSEGAPRIEHENQLTIQRSWGIEIAHTPLSLGLIRRIFALPRDAVLHAHVAQSFLPEIVWLLAKLHRRPYLIHFHLDVDPSGKLGWLLPFYKRHVFARALRGATFVIALSDEQSSFLSNSYAVLPERVVVVPNGVEPQYFMPARPARDVTPDEPLRLLYVGRLDVQKNVSRLLSAIAMLSEPVELVIVGDGELRQQLSEQAADAMLANVRLVGVQRGAALLDWYEWAEAFVLPSDKEGMPLVVLEAMAAGLPIIATDVSGSRELLAGVGLLADPSSPGLADAITRLAKCSTLRATLSENSAARAQGLSWDALVTNVEDLYSRL